MSHFTKITAEIRDLDVLKQALKKMNLTLEKNTNCRYYNGAAVRENVIKLPGVYDVAVEAQSDGTYALDADFYEGHVAKYIGANGEELLRQYSIEKLKKEAKNHGYKVYDKGNGILKILDTKRAGKIEIECLPNGKIEIKTSEYKGKSCMNFEIIEKALGRIDSTKKTPEYYKSEKATAQVRMEVN